MAREHHTFHSSRVVEGWYDDQRHEVTLAFPDGTRWRYSDVPYIIWMDLISAPSAGHFVNHVLTKNYRNDAA